MTRTNPLWDVIQAYMDAPEHRYPPKPADLARETGVSEQLFSKWKSRPTLPSPGQLAKVAVGTGISFERLLYAALAGKHYLPYGESLGIEMVHATRGHVQPNPEWLDVLARYGVGDPLTPSRAVELFKIGRGGDGNADATRSTAPMNEDGLSEDAPNLRSVANKGVVEPEDGALTDP